jgi:hypothetical protein
MTSGELISEYLPTYKMRLEHSEDYKYDVVFADDGTPPDGLSAPAFSVAFSSSKSTSFEYDKTASEYRVSQYGAAYIDGNDDSQLSVTNVIILETSVSMISGDSEGRLDIKLTGGGIGYYVCGGKYIEIDWKKDGAAARFIYTLKDGTPLVLGRGKSYVCIAPRNTAIDFSRD